MDLKKIKWLVPFLAILVIFESVLIVQKIGTKINSGTKEGNENLAVNELTKGEKPIIVSLLGEESVTAGGEGRIEVAIKTIKNVNLDGVDILLGYDPEYLEIVGVTPMNKFSYLARNWVEPEKKRVLVSMVENEKMEGVAFAAGEEVNLATISYRAKKAGITKVTVVGENEAAGTVFAENKTAAKVPFVSEDFSLKIQ